MPIVLFLLPDFRLTGLFYNKLLSEAVSHSLRYGLRLPDFIKLAEFQFCYFMGGNAFFLAMTGLQHDCTLGRESKMA